jgi:hypothetical protein
MTCSPAADAVAVQGPWCAVDPATCDRFAGEIDGQERNEVRAAAQCSKILENKAGYPNPFRLRLVALVTCA